MKTTIYLMRRQYCLFSHKQYLLYTVFMLQMYYIQSRFPQKLIVNSLIYQKNYINFLWLFTVNQI